MRLIVLASNKNKSTGNDSAELYNNFNADINIAPGSKIALQSITTELAITETNDSGEPISNQLDEFENYYIELMDLSVESYYGFVNEKIFNGSGKNIIGTLSRNDIDVVFVPREDGTYTSTPPVPPAWTPADITSTFWIDSADLSTLTLDASNLVEVWEDKSGENNDLSSVAGTRPLYTDATSGIKFTTDRMETTGTFSMSSQPYTFYMVVNQYNDNNNQFILDSPLGASRNFIFENSSLGLRLFAGTNLLSDVRLGENQNVLVKCIVDGATSKIYRNDVLIKSGNAGTDLFTGLVLGQQRSGSAGFKGSVMELIIVPSILSSADDTLMNTYLSTKWGTSKWHEALELVETTTIYKPNYVGGGTAVTKYSIDYIPDEPIFLDLLNKSNIALRNLSARLVRYDGARVPIAGPMSINILIKSPDE